MEGKPYFACGLLVNCIRDRLSVFESEVWKNKTQIREKEILGISKKMPVNTQGCMRNALTNGSLPAPSRSPAKAPHSSFLSSSGFEQLEAPASFKAVYILFCNCLPLCSCYLYIPPACHKHFVSQWHNPTRSRQPPRPSQHSNKPLDKHAPNPSTSSSSPKPTSADTLEPQHSALQSVHADQKVESNFYIILRMRWIWGIRRRERGRGGWRGSWRCRRVVG